MLISLIAAMLPWQVVAETAGAPLSNAQEQAIGTLRRGFVTVSSNLRTSPSMQSEVIAIAKEGSQVEILMETERWFHVRSEAGAEAWIHKSLVHIAREPLKVPSDTPIATAQPDVMEILFASGTRTSIPLESSPGNSPEVQGSSASSTAPIDEPQVSLETPETGWFAKVILSHIHSPGAFVIISLVVALTLSIVLQLRGARQLRRAMQEIGQILDIVEEMYADAVTTSMNASGSTIPPVAVQASSHQTLHPLIEFSPIEQTVLEALSAQRAVQEAELAKVLDKKGHVSVLIKAIIGDILRKTGTADLPWIEVSYAQGGYNYRLTPEAVSKLSTQQSDRP